ncbi:MAG: hypothetical protein FJX76_26290, partial [Armatimonadetes bacterium]|nr:hypothetical protein [Armatimonadota bacterium]
MIPCDMERSLLVHEFELGNFGSVAFHGFLSTAETRSDKCWGHGERLLKPQDMVGVALDLSSKTHRKLLPKYAWCVVPERPSAAGFPESTDYPLIYGGVMAVLRQDVQQRSSWSYGDSLALYPDGSPRFRAHTFQENALRKDMVASTHFLEAQVWGELTLEDVDHFVVTPGQKYSIDREREYTREHPEAEGGEAGDFDRFLECCRRLQIPVHVGEIGTRLKRTRDETGAEASPAIET